jgi:hypothetical protein
MSQPRQPSPKEITNKVSSAIKAIELNSIQVIDDRHNDEALILCDTRTMDDVFRYIYGFLAEIQDADPITCFNNTGRNVEKSYHKGFKDLELFSYSWYSPSFEEMLYLKFATKKPTKSNPNQTLIYFHLDLHHDRPKKS